MRGNVFRPFRDDPVTVSPLADEASSVSAAFADDVIVDFPSVAPAVDRIRSGFLADERAMPISADVRLTRADAVTGTTVPLSVPVRRTCVSCGGRGESWTETCRRCRGTGSEVFSFDVQVTLPAGVVDGARFRFSVIPPHHPPTRIELRVAVG